KIAYASKDSGAILHIEKISSQIKEYMVLKAVISFFTGLIVWVALLIVGTDYAFLWAVIAFLFNFIPNIGSIIAAVPAVLLTLVQLGTLSSVIVAAVYVVINVLIGSVVEPKVMGKGLGLSTLVVFLSLIFWGWLLGIVGMLLSIPLTIMVKIILDDNEKTKWVSVLLGTGEEK
ncbi:MAG: AI-2E family transporter, partial [Campylobacterota bacterium]